MIGYILLAISVSIDSLGIGFVYGIKDTQLATISKFILFLISVVITTFAISVGNLIIKILPINLANYIGISILVFLGLWIINKSLKDEEQNSDSITSKILRNPINSDIDCSKKIDFKESLFLGFTLSLDSIGVGICSSIVGFNSVLFPIFVAFFQLIFLNTGIFLGKKINSKFDFPKNSCSVISGILLVILGISKIFI